MSGQINVRTRRGDGLMQALLAAWRAWWSPYFRDSRGQPLWAELTVTLLFNTVVALALAAFSWVWSAGRIDFGWLLSTNFVVAQCIGFAIHGLFMLAAALLGADRIDGWRGARRAAFFSLLPLTGVVLGYAAGIALLGLIDTPLRQVRLSVWLVAAIVMTWAVLTLLWWRFFHHKMRLAEAEQQLAADRARSAELEQQAADAQLRTLRAQIEPHFLFNTLANVVSLIDAQPADARRMLERLIDLLRGSLSASRAQQATLGHELDLVRAYLDILSIRMGARLRYEIEAAPALLPLPLPPMLLQPLVENAIQHGLEPKVEGGHVRVRATAAGDTVEIAVEDNGVGFGAVTRGGGVGLANLRQRLAALYRERGRLAIEDLRPGTRVRLTLPAAPPPAATTRAEPSPA